MFGLVLPVRAQISLVPFYPGAAKVTDIANCGDDRLFIVGQQGFITIVDLQGVPLPDLFLNISNKVNAFGGEQGLLGIAFSPNYNTDGLFYLNYTGLNNSSVISRFRVSATNANKADSLSEEILITVPQPYTNHNGGAMHFGPDGYLYISFGDGGAGGDPGNRAQDLQVLLGKLLRIDVSPDTGYIIPPDNPFVQDPAADDHIWSYGLRNAWRFSFDRVTGDIWVADVGQNQWEEVNFRPAASPGGENYGWRCYEGNNTYNPAGCPPPSAMIFPVYESGHPPDCSVTGGYVYRGANYASLFGKYLFTDYCSGNFRTLHPDGNGGFTPTSYGNFGNISYSTFGEDKYGELYVGRNTTGVFKIVSSDCQPVAFISVDDTIVHKFKSYLLETPYAPGLTYQWYFNNSLLQGANLPSYLATTSGDYFVTVIRNDSCLNVSDKVTLVLGQEEGFYIYPNPVSDFTELVWSLNFSGDKTVEVIDATGKLCFKTKLMKNSINYKLDTRKLSNGVYVIRVINDGRSFYQKMVVQ